MEKDILGVALVHKLCPICGRKMEEEIVLNQRLTAKAAKEVKELDGKAIGYSKNACEKCLKFKDKAVFCIGIDESKSKINNDKCSMDNMYRTGQIAGVRKDFQLFIDYPEHINKTANGVSFCFIEENVGKQIGLFI